ncbi:MAG: hypothetical protein ACTHN5_18385 [Phycisphaerae bacterium]
MKIRRWGGALAGCLCVLSVIGCGRGQGEQAANGEGTPGGGGGDTGVAVVKGADGTLGVAEADGKPYDGVKLSKYDADMRSPQIAVASDGTIHVAYIERMYASPYTFFVFHRSSSDGGKTWSETKNLSEDMPGFNVGTCQLCIDGQDRVFVIWRTGLKEGFSTLTTPAGLAQNNLVYRMLDHGKWTKILPVHPPGSSQTQDDGSISFSACTDAAGHVEVIYNTIPDRFDPEKYAVVSGKYVQHCPGVEPGLVWQVTLDGSAGKPKQLFCLNFRENAAKGKYAKSCDGVNALDLCAGADGGPQFIAQVYDENHRAEENAEIDLFDGGKGTKVLTLPPTWKFNASPPRLLVDAKGKKHIVALYDAGEHPSVRDYVIGSDDEPATLISAKPPKGTVAGFQAFQSAGGKMVVLVQLYDQGMDDRGDTFVTTSDGGAWSEPICITNNAGREKWWSKNTGALSGVAGGSRFGPRPGAAAIDKTGHLVIALINAETGSFGVSAGGVVYTSGSSSTPRLYFYRF